MNCRYCLDNENTDDLISPCKCKGEIKYVHRECLLKWFDERNRNFRQFNFCCEICKTDYSHEYNAKNLNKKIFLQLTIQFFLFLFFFLNLTVFLPSTRTAFNGF